MDTGFKWDNSIWFFWMTLFEVVVGGWAVDGWTMCHKNVFIVFGTRLFTTMRVPRKACSWNQCENLWLVVQYWYWQKLLPKSNDQYCIESKLSSKVNHLLWWQCRHANSFHDFHWMEKYWFCLQPIYFCPHFVSLHDHHPGVFPVPVRSTWWASHEF